MALSDKETIELILKIKNSNNEEEKNPLYEKLIEDNIGLIKKIAEEISTNSDDYEDLIQIGYLAFIKAIENYDPNKKVKFQTYLYKVLRSKMLREYNDMKKTISIPEYVSQKLNEIIDTEELLKSKLNRKPTDEEVANELNIDLEELISLKQYAIKVSSLEDNRNSDDGESLLLSDLISSKDKNPEDEMISSEEQELLNLSIDTLNEREKDIVKKYFGLSGETKLNVNEISDIYRISKERVRQIIQLALKKIKREMED